MDTLETIWIFFKMLFCWVALPTLGIVVIIKLFFLVFNKVGNKLYDRRAEKKLQKKIEGLMAKGKTEDEKRTIRYFIKHDEAEWSDADYKDELARLWFEGDAKLETPREEDGTPISMTFDEEFRMTDPDQDMFLRRVPDGDIIPSAAMRLSVFFGEKELFIRTMKIDMLKHTAETEMLSYDYVNILDVSGQRLHPVQMIDGKDARVLSATLSILEKGGKRKTIKGMEYDTEKLVTLIKDELEFKRK